MSPARRTFTIDLDSTICETYGLAKRWAASSTSGYTGDARLMNPLLAVVSTKTGEVLMARLSVTGRANSRTAVAPHTCPA